MINILLCLCKSNTSAPFIFIAIAFLSHSVPLHAISPNDYCEKYAKLSYPEASKEYVELLSLSRKLDSKVGNYLKAGTPQDDPELSKTAKRLGDTIGKSYALCICNKPISQSRNCQAFIEHIKKSKFNK